MNTEQFPSENRFQLTSADIAQPGAQDSGADLLIDLVSALRTSGSDADQVLATSLESIGWSALSAEQIKDLLQVVEASKAAHFKSFQIAQNVAPQTPAVATDAPPPITESINQPSRPADGQGTARPTGETATRPAQPNDQALTASELLEALRSFPGLTVGAPTAPPLGQTPDLAGTPQGESFGSAIMRALVTGELPQVSGQTNAIAGAAQPAPVQPQAQVQPQVQPQVPAPAQPTQTGSAPTNALAPALPVITEITPSLLPTAQSMGAKTDMANAPIMVPYVTQTVSITGALLAPVVMPGSTTTGDIARVAGNSNSSAFIGSSDIVTALVQLKPVLIEQPRVETTTPAPSPVGFVHVERAAAQAASVAEGTNQSGTTFVTFTVTRSNGMLADTVPYTLGGITANDLASGSSADLAGSVSFAAGETSKNITVAIGQDSTMELNESLTVTLSNGAYASVTGDPAQVTIANDDQPTVSVAVAPSSVLEDGTANLLYTFTLSNASAFDTTVNYTLSGTAANGVDYSGSAVTGSVTIAAGSLTASITIDPTTDTLFEDNETVIASITSASSNSVALSSTGTAASGTIADDDHPVFSVGNVTVSEGGLASFTVTRSGASAVSQTVDVSSLTLASPDTAQAGDFTALTTQTLTFAAGVSEQTFSVQTTQDSVFEGAETFRVQLANATGGALLHGTNATATGTIVDDGRSIGNTTADDDRSPTFSITSTPQTRVEGSTLQFVVTRTGLGTEATLDYVLLPMNGDSTSLPQTRTGSISFSAEESSKTIDVVTLDDQLVNGDQRFVVALTGGTAGVNIAGATAEGTITSNDAEIGIQKIEVVDTAPGVITYKLTLTRDGATANFSHSVHWNIAGAGENPAGQGDFTLPGNRTITFAPGATEATATFTARAGLMSEGVRGFQVQLSEIGNVSANNVVLGVDSARANINPDGVGVSIVPISANSVEGNGSNTPQTFEIRLTEAAAAPITVHWAAVSYANANTSLNASANDFVGGRFPSGDVTFGIGQTVKTITITPAPDSEIEQNERYNVNISVTDGLAGVIIGTAVGQIINDEASLAFNSATFVADEGSESDGGILTATVARDGFIRSTVSASWKVVLNDGQANSSDFAGGQDALGSNDGLPSGTVEMLPGEVQAPIQIRFAGDNIIEANETFQIVLFAPGSGTQLGSTTATTGTIRNDDMAFAMGSATLSPVNEGQAGQTTALSITVVRSGDARSAASVVWSVTGSGDNPTNNSDFTGNTANTLVFAANETSKTFSVNLKGDDTLEADEQFIATLVGVGNAGSGTIDAAKASTTVSVRNDDSQVSFDAGSTAISAKENAANAFTYTLTRAGDLTRSISVGWQLDFTGKTANADDFTATSGTATFAAHSATATFTVVPASDTVVEPDETFAVKLVAPAAGSGIALGAANTATGTLLNDDSAISIAGTALSASEGGDGTTGSYSITLRRSGDSTQLSSVSWTVAGAELSGNGNVHALSANEFSGATSGTVTWDASDADDKTITVNVKGDDLVEGDEAFRLDLASIAGSNDLLAKGYYAIVRDDDAQLAITALAASIVEGKAGSSKTLSFQVVRSGDLSSVVEVDVIKGGSANGISLPAQGAQESNNITVGVGNDVFAHIKFDPQAETVTITYNDGRPSQTIQVGGGVQTATVSVTLAGDDSFETGETLTLSLANASATPAAGRTQAHVVIDVAQASASTAIVNDDEIFTSTPSAASVTEGNNSDNPTVTYTIARSDDGDITKETTIYWRVAGHGEMQVNADDFLASFAAQYDVSVANDGLPSGRLTWAANETAAKTVTLQIASDATIEADEGFRLALTAPNGNAEMRDSAAVVLLGDDLGLNLVARQSLVVEGNAGDTARYLTYDFVRAGNTESELTVYGKIALGGDGNNIVAADLDLTQLPTGWAYDSQTGILSGSLTFAAGASGKALALPIVSDSVPETSPKTATLTLFSNAELTARLQNSSTDIAPVSITLKDDDAELRISTLQATAYEGNTANGYKEFTFTVDRAGNTNQESSVKWKVVTETGITVADFSGNQDTLGSNGGLPSGSLVFAMNSSSSQTITLRVAQDSLKEGDESLHVRLFEATPGTSIAVANANGTIQNDDAEVAFVSGSLLSDQNEGDAGSFPAYTFNLQRTGYLNQTSTVTWSLGSGATVGSITYNGTHAGDFDFPGGVVPSGTLIWAANDAADKTITVNVKGDSSVPGRVTYLNGTPIYFPYSWWGYNPSSTLEADEAFTVNLASTLTGTSIGGSPAVGIVRNDDVKIQVMDLITNRPEGRPETQWDDSILQGVVLQRLGDDHQTVSIDWYLGGGQDQLLQTIVADRARATNGTTNTAEVQTLYPTLIADSMATLKVGDTLLTTAALDAGPTLAELVAAIQAAASPEVQKLAPPLTANSVHTLTMGSSVLTTAALDANPTLAELVAALQAATGYAAAPFTVAAGAEFDADKLVLTWKTSGDVSGLATLAAGPVTVLASAVDGTLYADAPFTVAAGTDANAGKLVLTWKSPGDVADVATLSSATSGVLDRGTLTWNAGDSANKSIYFRPVADNVVETDTIFRLYINPSADSAKIDEIGFDKNSSAVYAVPFTTTGSADWDNYGNQLPIATFVIKRDESGIKRAVDGAGQHRDGAGGQGGEAGNVAARLPGEHQLVSVEFGAGGNREGGGRIAGGGLQGGDQFGQRRVSIQRRRGQYAAAHGEGVHAVGGKRWRELLHLGAGGGLDGGDQFGQRRAGIQRRRGQQGVADLERGHAVGNQRWVKGLHFRCIGGAVGGPGAVGDDGLQ